MLRRDMLVTLCLMLLFHVQLSASSDSCPRDCRYDLCTAFSQTNITLLSYATTCPIFESFKTCYENTTATCINTAADDLNYDVFNYTCGEGHDQIVATGECWTKEGVTTAINNCSVPMTSLLPAQMCSAYTDYYDSLKTSILDLCDQVAYEVMMEFVKVTTHSERQRFGCPAPVITRPPLNIACYDCNSGGTSWRNPHCSPDGTVTDSWVGKTTCTGTCFAKIDRWTHGVVYRGCAENVLPIEYPRPLPRSGCRLISGEMCCFCDTDHCNNMSMTQFLS